jgi:hypothetical protein
MLVRVADPDRFTAAGLSTGLIYPTRSRAHLDDSTSEVCGFVQGVGWHGSCGWMMVWQSERLRTED